MLQGVITSAGVGFGELTDASWCGVPEGVKALVVVSGHEEGDTPAGERVDKPEVHRVEILELVNDQVVEVEEFGRVERARLDPLNAELN